MSIIDSKNFVGGGMDTDSAPELIAQNDYVSAYNVRTTGDKEGEEGYVVAIESNDIIPITLPAGLNKCIGSQNFDGARKIYKFIYNSQLKHCITEIDFDTNTETILYTNLVDSGGENALILNVDTYVTDIKLLENFLIFRNSANEPCFINIERLKTGDYGVITKNDFILIKEQPLGNPSAYYLNDTFFTGNFLSGRLFQFREQFVYDDNQTSVWGSISNRPVPVAESNPNVGTASATNNSIVVTVEIGSDRVTELNIGARQGNLDWYLIKIVKRDYVLAITDTAIDIAAGIYEAYNPITNKYSFVFRNDKLYTSVDVLETDLLQDYIPKECEALEVINGRGDVNSNSSVLAIGSTLEGYERPVADVNLTVYGINSGIEIPNYDDSGLMKFRKISEYDSGNQGQNTSFFYFKGLPKLGDKITIFVSGLNGVIIYTYQIEITALEVDNLDLSIIKLKNQISAQGGVRNINTYAYATASLYTRRRFALQPGDVLLTFESKPRRLNPDNWSLSGTTVAPRIDLVNIGSGDIQSIPSLKLNSSYQLALAYYDEYGRAFPIITGENYILNTPSYARYRGNIPNISWAINSTPPENAKTYQWLMSPNTTHANTVYVDGLYRTGGDKGAYIEINLNTLNKYQDNNPSTNVVYDFSPGDRASFCFYLDNDENQIWFDGNQQQIIDVDVLGYEPVITVVGGVNITNYILKVRKPAGFNLATILNKVVLLEIYTPLSSVQQDDNTIFFEVSDKYLIEDRLHTVSTGIISSGDCYFKTRNYNVPDPAGADNLNGNYTFLVEDFSFSDFYPSRFNQYGRPRTFFDTPENETFPATIRYSYEFVSRSKINQINRFYAENQVTYDLKYGSIKKLFQRDNTLICIQETKVGYVPVSISIIEDQAAQNNVATSTLLLNKIRYSDSGSIGIGNAVESFAEYSGDIYFVDPNRSEPIRIAYNGVESIAGKMSKFFRRTLKNAVEDGVKLIGYYNVYNREYILTTEQFGSVIIELQFNASNWDPLEDFTVDTQTLAISTAPTKGTVELEVVSSLKTGNAIYTPDIGESGSDTFSFSFLPEGEIVPVIKNICINISEGQTEVPPFSLGEVSNQGLSVISDISVQAGGFPITAPVPISITSPGQYRINEGAWVSSSGYFYPGDEVVVRINTTSATPLTTVSTTLTIGTESAVFSATTASFEEVGYFVIDIFGVDDLDNIGAYIVAGGGGIVSNSPVIYPGNNLYPSVVDPDDSLIVMSDFYEFSVSTSGYRMIFNIEKYKATYPSATSVNYTIVGLKDGGSGTIQSNYSSRSSAGTIIEVSPAPDYMISLVGGAVILPVTTIVAPMAGAPGPLPKPPTDATSVYLYVSYDYTTDALTVNYPV